MKQGRDNHLAECGPVSILGGGVHPYPPLYVVHDALWAVSGAAGGLRAGTRACQIVLG